MLKKVTLVALACAASSLVALPAATAEPGSIGIYAGPSRTVTCAGRFSGTAKDLIVPAGPNCIVQGARITHDVIVEENGFLNAANTAIGHDLIASKPQVVTTGFTEDGGGPVTVGHDVVISGPLEDQFGNHTCCPGINDAIIGHDLRVTDLLVDFELFVLRDKVRHDLVVSANTTGICCGFGPIGVGDNVVGHDLVVTDNTAPGGDVGWITVFENRAGHDAICSGNSPAVTRNTPPELDWFGRSLGANQAGHANSCG